MSTLISDVINDAAEDIGDPNKQRVTITRWLSIYNSSQREVCQKANVLRFENAFHLVADQRIYSYPHKMVVMTGVRVSETPDDKNSFRDLEEIFEDQFRHRTSTRYPSASLPDSYFSTSSWFHLIGSVTATINSGGCITYYGLPDRVSMEQFLANQVLQIPDFAQDYLIRRMVIHGMKARNRYAEAKAELEIWEADMVTFQDKLDDRSIDKRGTIAPRVNRLAGMR